ncbi:MAG TPA: BMC domain-containing protein [Vicinamibacterales bacterium]
MKKAPALAVIEFRDIPTGIDATDAMLKKAPIAFIKSGTITRGRFLTLIGGSTAAVEESLHEGLFRAGDSVLDHLLLADVHPRVYDAILGSRRAAGPGALAVIETDTVASSVRVAELALKGTPVELVELRLADSGLSGKGVSIYQGELPDILAAVEIVVGYMHQAGGEVRHAIISAPHEALARQIGSGTSFGSAALLDLDGEIG